MAKDSSKKDSDNYDSVVSVRHTSSYDSDRINQAVERASHDDKFIGNAVQLLQGLEFPAFKINIVAHVKGKKAPEETVSLFESLSGYIKFRDAYHVQKALEENNMEKKTTYQITDETRESPVVRTRDTTRGSSIKEREAVNKEEERKDYPEVTPTAMSDFVCDRCGKPFQNQNDLYQHQKFESGKTTVL